MGWGGGVKRNSILGVKRNFILDGGGGGGGWGGGVKWNSVLGGKMEFLFSWVGWGGGKTEFRFRGKMEIHFRG